MDAVEPVLASVYTADAPAAPDDDSWQSQPHLECLSFTEGVSPTHPQAEFRWRFGFMRRAHNDSPDSPDGIFEALAYRIPLQLQRKYVLIRFTTPAVMSGEDEIVPERNREWIGYIKDEGAVHWNYEDIVGGTNITGGDQTFQAVDLTYFLGRSQITGTSSREADKPKRPFSYNSGSGDGRDVDLADRKNRMPPDDEGVDPFEPLEFSFEKDAILWNAAAIVKHLLAEQCPRDNDDEPSPLPFYLDENAIPYLDWYEPTVRVEGRSVLELLDEVIDRRRGLTWWLTTGSVEGVFVAVISVSSYAVAALELPEEEELPAAAVSVSLDDPSVFSTLLAPNIVRDGSHDYDRIRVRGARSTTTFSAIGVGVETTVYGYTFGTPIGSLLDKAWSDEDEDDYSQGVLTLDPDYATYDDGEKETRNDRYRQSAKFERVFRYFTIDTSGALMPIIIQSTGSIVGQRETQKRVVRLRRLTAMKVGYDYANATAPVANGEIEEGEEYLRPFALGYLPTGCSWVPTTLGALVPGEPPTSSDGGWRRLHDWSSHKETGFSIDGSEEDERRFGPNFSLTPLAGEPGFIMQALGGMAHALGATDVDEPSKFTGGIDWRSLLVTVTAEWDCYCEAVWPEVVPEASPVQELLIQVRDERARFDWLSSGTVYDLNENGNLKQVTTAGALRDDRKLCETIARLAHAWYGVERAAVTLNFGSVVQPFGVGDLLTTISTGAAQQTVNAVVSQITHDFVNGRTTIQCGYAELDFSGLV